MIKPNDDFFMQIAISEAILAYESGEVPVGAVVVSSGKIVAKAHNQMQRLNDPTAHAEMIALTAACASVGSRYLSECTLYVTLEPCPMCAAATNWAQIGRIVFGASDPKRGFGLHQPSLLHSKTQICEGVLKDKCLEVLETFFWKLRS
jgi:tRNA(adenine34) deaminase